MYGELPNAPWIEDCERWGYPRFLFGIRREVEDGIETEDDYPWCRDEGEEDEEDYEQEDDDESF